MKNNLGIIFKSNKFRAGFVIFAILLVVMIIFPLISSENYLKMNYTMFQRPSSKLLLGADNFGRNELVELIVGGKTSFFIGILAGAIATGIGLILGLFSGYIGGQVDNILSSITNIFLVIPSFIILVLISVSISSRSYLTTALVIGFTSWPWTTRAVRAQTISLKNRDHVNLAKVSGYNTTKIIITEILPYIASYVGMAFILQVASGILSEATISMLGLGPQNTVTLGLMLNWATMYEAQMSGAWWAFIPPVLMIALITFSLNLMNTGLDQIFNPQIRS